MSPRPVRPPACRRSAHARFVGRFPVPPCHRLYATGRRLMRYDTFRVSPPHARHRHPTIASVHSAAYATSPPVLATTSSRPCSRLLRSRLISCLSVDPSRLGAACTYVYDCVRIQRFCSPSHFVSSCLATSALDFDLAPDDSDLAELRHPSPAPHHTVCGRVLVHLQVLGWRI